MEPIRVDYHYEEGSWWAESPDIKGWLAVADTYEELVELVEEGIPFALECEALEREAKLESMVVDADSAA